MRDLITSCLALIASLTLAVTAACAGHVELLWDPSATPGASYVLYAHTNANYQTNLSTAAVKIDVGTNRAFRVENISVGKWYFSATSKTPDRVESAPTDLLIVDVPTAPSQMRVLVPQYMATLTNAEAKDLGFFKIRIVTP